MYREIMRSKKLTPEAKAIYAYLCSFAGSGESCYPGAELMRTELQMGTDRFYKHMHLLTEAGIVQKIQERKGNRWGNTRYILNHFTGFQLSQNGSTENEDTQKRSTQSKSTNSNSINNNSLNINILYICDLLNQEKEKARSKGRLKPGNVYYVEVWEKAGVRNEDVIALAEELAAKGADVDWYSFDELVTKRLIKTKGNARK